MQIISSAPELCYLTQVIIRLFENTSKEVNDPKRFRIEILFSPGATATPLHMSELRRDEDASRFDTEPLQLISSDYLTCKEVEDYFTESIKEGETEDDEDMPSTTMTSCEEGKKVEVTPVDTPDASTTKSAQPEALPSPVRSIGTRSVVIAEDRNLEIEPEVIESTDQEDEPEETGDINESKNNDEELVESSKDDVISRIFTKQFVWNSVAAASFVIGVGFLVLSREIVHQDFKTRRWSRR